MVVMIEYEDGDGDDEDDEDDEDRQMCKLSIYSILKSFLQLL